MAHPVVHWEVSGKDAARLSEFYSKAFDWEVTHIEQMNYNVVSRQSGQGIGGGIFQAPDGTPSVTFYIQADDLDAYLKRIEANGGKTTMPPMPIEGVGAAAMFSDPEGHVLGLFKPLEGQTEMAPDGKTPHSVVHWEIAGKNGAKLTQFYGKVFDWKITHDEKMNYDVVDPESKDGIGGGIFQAPEGVPPYVTVYVQVGDPAAALKKIERAGGKTTVPPMPVPGVGTIAMFADPEGNVVGLYQPA